jgi:hypothetical protein
VVLVRRHRPSALRSAGFNFSVLGLGRLYSSAYGRRSTAQGRRADSAPFDVKSEQRVVRRHSRPLARANGGECCIPVEFHPGSRAGLGLAMLAKRILWRTLVTVLNYPRLHFASRLTLPPQNSLYHIGPSNLARRPHAEKRPFFSLQLPIACLQERPLASGGIVSWQLVRRFSRQLTLISSAVSPTSPTVG